MPSVIWLSLDKYYLPYYILALERLCELKLNYQIFVVTFKLIVK